MWVLRRDLNSVSSACDMSLISPKTPYYFHHIVREGWLGSTSPFICRRMLTESKGVLNPVFIGSGRSTRILILGKDILEYQRREAHAKSKAE